MDGIFPLWKPKGFTSHDCVNKARGMFKTKKIGHTGTLDPDVEGVLPLCVGKATKIVPFLVDTNKEYEAKVTLGYSTDTEDATGKTLAVTPVLSSIEVKDIKEKLKLFRGEITQIPPMYSAVKVNGKKLYEYAREGIEVERPARQVEIKSIELINDELIKENETVTFSIKVICSKGTYIRTLCVDLGQALGYSAHMAHLVRSKTADISKHDCYTFEKAQELVNQSRQSELMLPITRALSHMDTWDVDEHTKALILNGRVLDEPIGWKEDKYVVTYMGEALAIYQRHPRKSGLIKPLRVL